MEQPKILVYAPLHQEGFDYLAKQNVDVVTVDRFDLDVIGREVVDSDAVVASSTFMFDDSVFSGAPQLKVVGRTGVGVDCIDLDAATRHNVQIVNTPLAIIEPVAEHTIALFLALVRRVVIGDHNVRGGLWATPADLPGPELRARTLGIIGFGNTGKRVAEIARLGFQMEIIYFDLRAAPEVEERLGARRAGTLEELLAASDFVSVHVDLNPATQGLINEQSLRAMKPTAYFVNISRGGVVDEDALFQALEKGWIAGAGLDVFGAEPPAKDHPLWQLDNVVLTPHRGGLGEEAAKAAARVTEDVVRVLRGEEVRFPVNRLEG